MFAKIVFGSLGFYACYIIYLAITDHVSYLLVFLPVILISFFGWLLYRWVTKDAPYDPNDPFN